LNAAAVAAGRAVETVAGPDAAVVCWSGDAAGAYRGVRDRLGWRAGQVAQAASAAAGAVLDWVRDAVPAHAALRVAFTDLTDLQRRAELAAASGFDPARSPGLSTLQADLDHAWYRWQAALDGYRAVAAAAAGRLLAARDLVEDRALDGLDQFEGATGTLWGDGVAGPIGGVWALTGRALTDRDRWWDTVSGLPAAVTGTASAAAGAVADDPWGALTGTAGQLVGAQAWSEGRYGEAAAGMAVVFIPGSKWLTAGQDLGRIRFAATLADPDAPLPIPQTIDEMLAGVDLDRHEHATLGHALRRHVDVDRDYLMDRLTHGTLLPDGTRGWAPSEASRFTDRATAEATITRALQENQFELRGLSHREAGTELKFELRSPTPIGEVMTRTDGGFSLRDGHVLRLVVKVGPQGPYIRTAYVT
jgi:hypothetical protein